MAEKVRIRTKAEIEDDIQRLEEWLLKQPHLPRNIEKEMLAGYVHGTKSLEIAKQKLDHYFTSKGKAPQLFSFPARDPRDQAFKVASGALKMFFLPKTTPERYTIMMVIFDLDFSKFDHTQYVIRLMMMLELALLLWPDREGIIFLSDIAGIDSSILTKLRLTSGALFVHWFQNTIPMKMKRGVAVNTPKFFETVINAIFKPFVSTKLFERLVFTSEGGAALKKYVAQDLLPCDFGGMEQSSTELNNYWLDQLQQKRDWFLKTSMQLVDETKRPANKQGTFGVEGTFRSLSID